MNDDGQLRAVHLILDFEPISRSFLDVGNSIRARDYRLARIDVSRPHFLANDDLPPVDHPIPQGIPLAVEPLREVALGEAILREETASSSSLELEIDKFRFEEETVHISEAEEVVRAPSGSGDNLHCRYNRRGGRHGSPDWPFFERINEG